MFWLLMIKIFMTELFTYMMNARNIEFAIENIYSN